MTHLGICESIEFWFKAVPGGELIRPETPFHAHRAQVCGHDWSQERKI